MTWYWISLPQMTFGIAVVCGIVERAAPIAHWSIGRSESYILHYWQQRGARIVRLPHAQEDDE